MSHLCLDLGGGRLAGSHQMGEAGMCSLSSQSGACCLDRKAIFVIEIKMDFWDSARWKAEFHLDETTQCTLCGSEPHHRDHEHLEGRLSYYYFRKCCLKTGYLGHSANIDKTKNILERETSLFSSDLSECPHHRDSSKIALKSDNYRQPYSACATIKETNTSSGGY